jgi:phage terminase large subunit
MSAAPRPRIDLAQRFIESVRTEPVSFVREVLNHRALPGEPTIEQDASRSWELDDFQVDLIEAVADVWRPLLGQPTRINHSSVPWITVRSGHGPGKTHTAALLATIFNTAWPGRIVVTAPKLAQLRTRVWGALRKINARAEPWFRSTHTIHDTAVYWHRPNEKGRLIEDRNWCILAETASQPENLAGHHEQFMMVIVEEASGVSEQLWPVIFGALSSGTVVILVAISNPTKKVGTYAESHLSPKLADKFFRYHVSLQNSRRINRAWVDTMVAKYTADSPIVKVRCYGEFADDDALQLIATQWVTDAHEREELNDGSVARLRVSIDVADGGENETVITAMKHLVSRRRLLKMKRYSFPQHVSSILAADEAEKIFYELGGVQGVDDFVVDSLGVGAGTAGTLMLRGHSVIGYQGGAASSNPLRFRCRRVQSFLGMRDDFRDGRIEFAEAAFDGDDADELMAQLTSIRLKVSTDRVEDLQTKKEMQDDGIKSPDMADSLALQYATQAPTLLGQMDPSGEPEVHVTTSTVWSDY